VSRLVKINAILSDFNPNIHLPRRTRPDTDASYVGHTYAKREGLSKTKKTILGCLIPVLLIRSDVLAGRFLGYTSLDEAQLNVLSISGTP